MNAPETINAAPINLAHEVLLKADDALCVADVAEAILGGEKPKKAELRGAQKMLKQLADLGAERLARTALQEQVDNPPAPVAQGYAVKAPKRPLRRFGKEAAAKSAAMAAARLAGRGEVFALVPLGVAVRGAEWKAA